MIPLPFYPSPVPLLNVARKFSNIARAFLLAAALIAPGLGSAAEQTCAAVSLSDVTSWWKAEGDTKDMIGGNRGQLQGGVIFGPGKVGQAFQFDGIDGFVQLPDNFFPFPTSGSGNAAFTFECWFSTISGGVILGQHITGPLGPPSGGVPGIYVGTDGLLYVEMFWDGTIQQVVSA